MSGPDNFEQCEQTWQGVLQIYAVRIKTIVNDQFRRNKLARQIKEIVDRKIRH